MPTLAEIKARRLAAQQGGGQSMAPVPSHAPKPIPENASLWDRIGRLPGALATGVRVGAGVLASPGGLWGATIGAGGEGLAEVIENPGRIKEAFEAVPDVVRHLSNPETANATRRGFEEGAKVPIQRMALEGAIGAVPAGNLFKAGRFIESGLRSGAMSGVGSLGRNYANDEELDWGAAGTSAALGGLIGGGLGKISGDGRAFKSKADYQQKVKGPWMAGVQPERPVPAIKPTVSHPLSPLDVQEMGDDARKVVAGETPRPLGPFERRTTEESNKIGQIWADDLEAGYQSEKDQLKYQLGQFDKEKTAWQKAQEAEQLAQRKAAEAATAEAEKVRIANEQRIADGYTEEVRSYGDNLTGVDETGQRVTMRTQWINPEEEARKAAEKEAAKLAKAGAKGQSGSIPDDGGGVVAPRPTPPPIPPTPSGTGGAVAETPKDLASLLGVGDTVADDIASGAIEVRPQPKPLDNVSDRRMAELLKMFGGRRVGDPPEMRSSPRTDIDPPLPGEVRPAGGGPKPPPPPPSGEMFPVETPPPVNPLADLLGVEGPVTPQVAAKAPRVRAPRTPKPVQPQLPIAEALDDAPVEQFVDDFDQARQTTHPSFYDDGFDDLEEAVPTSTADKIRQTTHPSFFDDSVEGLEDAVVAPRPAPQPPIDDVVANTPLGKLLQVFRNRNEASGAHYKNVREAAATEPSLKSPLPLNDSKGKPYTAERIAGKNARQDAKAAGQPPTNRPMEAVVDNPVSTDPNEITAQNIERALAARKGTGMASATETADEATARLLREDLAAWGKVDAPSVPADDPIRSLPPKSASKAVQGKPQPAQTSFTPEELKTLKKLGVTDEELDTAPSEQLRAVLKHNDARGFTNAPRPSVEGTVGGTVDQLSPEELAELLKREISPAGSSLKELRKLLKTPATPKGPAPVPSLMDKGAGKTIDDLTADELGELLQRGVTDEQFAASTYEDLQRFLATPSANKPGKAAKPKLVKTKKADTFGEGIPDDAAPSNVPEPKPKLVKQEKPFPKAEPTDPNGGTTLGSGLGGLQQMLGLAQKYPELALQSGVTALGAGIGAAQDEDNPLEGAALGGLAGAAAAFGGKRLAKGMKSLPKGREETSAFLDNLKQEIPHMQRGHYLASVPGLAANAIVGPAASGFTSALESRLKGDKRGSKALMELMKLLKPAGFDEGGMTVLPNLRKAAGEGYDEAKGLVETAERRTLGEAPSALAKAYASPGTVLTTGDVTVRNALIRAGYSVDEAKAMTMTNEPTSAIGKAMVNAQRTGGPWTNVALPFVRTPMNMLEQGAQRLPGVGAAYKIAKGLKNDDLSMQALRDIAAEQAVSMGTGMAAYGAGSMMDPETAKIGRRFVSNAGGRNAMTANIGFALGQDNNRKNPNTGNTLARGVGNAFAFPQTDAIEDQIKLVSNVAGGDFPDEMSDLPGGMYPKFFDEIKELFNPTPAQTKVPSGAPSLRKIKERKRGQ